MALGRWLRARPRSAEAHYLKARVALATGEAPGGGRRSWPPPGRWAIRPHPWIGSTPSFGPAPAGHAEAEPVLRRILEASRTPDPEAAEALARVYLETYRFHEAAAVIDRWIRDAPDDAKPYLWRTEVNTRLVKDSAAQIRDYRAALERDPTLDKARLGLADELRLAGRGEEAAPVYASYIARKPDDPAGHLGAGLVALDRGDDDRGDPPPRPDAGARPGQLRRRSRRGRRSRCVAARTPPRSPCWTGPSGSTPTTSRSAIVAASASPGSAAHDEARAEQEVAARLREDDQRLGKLQQALVANPGDRRLQAEVARWMIEHGHEEEGIRWARKILGERPDIPRRIA